MCRFEKRALENTKYFSAPVSGYSLIELIITIALFSLVFSALFAGVQFALSLVGTSKAEAGALALLVDKMEYIRSLPYNDVGTVGGVPAGDIPQTGTTTLNGITYNERVLIQYVDDPADGTGSSDSNGILADYKQIKIEYVWSIRGKTNSASLVSNIVPNGIETTAGGGTIRVNVFDAQVQPLSGAAVRFLNNTTTTTIDTTRYTDPNGVAYLAGAPAAANYEIIVTDDGYSTDGTYVATTSNPNPTTPPIAVLESQISTMNFQIDKLSDLTIRTLNPATYGNYTDTFSDNSGLISQSSTTVSSGALILSGSAGSYKSTGSAVSTSTDVTSPDAWYSASFSASTSASTSVRVSVMYDNAGVMTLVPDEDLPGNSVGFTTSPVDISSLSTTTYASLGLSAILTTTDANVTPYLHQWQITHVVNQTPIADVPLSIAGAKSIGTYDDGQPVLKYAATGVSDSSGVWDQSNIEYDLYTVTVNSTAYDVQEECPIVPFALSPDTTETLTFTLGPASGAMLRVAVTQADGTPIPDATVRLQNTGIDQQQKTSLCGQTYFGSGLYTAGDYQVTVSASGYATQTVTDVTVNASSSLTVQLN